MTEGVGDPDAWRGPAALSVAEAVVGLFGLLESEGGVLDTGAGQKDLFVVGSRSTCIGFSHRLLVGSDDVMRTMLDRFISFLPSIRRSASLSFELARKPLDLEDWS